MARQINRLHATLEYGLIAAALGPLGAMELGRAVRLGAALGTLAYRLDRFNRPVATRNLEIAFPELALEQRLTILRATYCNWGRMAAEWMHSAELNRANISSYVTYEGFENISAAEKVSGGRGLLVLTAHFGNFEWLPLAHSIYGQPIAIVHRPVRNPLVDSRLSAARCRFGNQAIARKGAARTVLKLLAQNGQVAIPLDLDVRHGVFVDFFGLKASTSDSLARLAIASGAPVVPAFMVREGTSPRHRITILPHLEVARGSDRDEAVRESTQRFTGLIEAMVRSHPDHWHWIHRRWKTRPKAEPRFY